MAYTDLWHCKLCGTMPEIVMQGKNFLVRCNHCDSPKVNVYADNIDQVVREWNHRNDPTKRSIFARLRGLFRRE
jgi:hypothetical protein